MMSTRCSRGCLKRPKRCLKTRPSSPLWSGADASSVEADAASDAAAVARIPSVGHRSP